MEISYLTWDDYPIAFEYLTEIERYSKVFKIGQSTKKIEHYYEGSLQYVEYFKDFDEDEARIIEELSILSVECYIKTVDFFASLRLVKSNLYENGILTLKRKELLDRHENIIAEEEIDVVTGKPDFTKTVKKIFAGHKYYSDFYPITTITYEEDGGIASIEVEVDDIMGQDNYGFYPDGIQGESDIDTWILNRKCNNEEVDYYIQPTLEPVTIWIE